MLSRNLLPFLSPGGLRGPRPGPWLSALALATGLAQSPAAVQAQAAIGGPVAEVPFVTVRNPTGDPDPDAAFGDARGPLSAGLCRVRRLDLGALEPLAQSTPAFLQEELLRIDTVENLPVESVLRRNRDAPDAGRDLLYIHGYNIGFGKGCRRAMQLQRNAKLTGRMVWFSWPSDGALANYMRDQADLYWSVPDIVRVVRELDSVSPDRVDLVAHSLGARGLVLALAEIASRLPEIQVGHVVLLAPDMDFEIFQRLLPRIRPIAQSITVYVAPNDHPLALSEQLHGYPRLGQAKIDSSALGGVEVVDLGTVDVEDVTGHLYHIFSPAVGQDLNLLLNAGMAAAERSGLQTVEANRWRFEP